MEQFTSKDIEAIREYRDKLEALRQEQPAPRVTPEEWKEFFALLEETGEFPAKFAGRIAEKEEVVYAETVDGKPVPTPEGKRQTLYYDVAFEEVNARYYKLQREYHEAIIKALQAYFERGEGGQYESTAAGIAEIITELLEDPEIRREIEKEARKAENVTSLTALNSMPNGEPLNFLLRVLAGSKSGRMIERSKTNRGERITLFEKEGALRYVRENKGNLIAVEIAQADKYLNKTNKTFVKMLLFTLQKMTAQNFPLEIGFSLQELVDLGMYSTTSNAARAIKEFFAQQSQTILSGTVKKGKKTVKEEGGVLFYHFRIDNGFVSLSVNDNFNMEFIASFYSVFPRFAYALSNNAFLLCRYIFYLARQHAQEIKEKGTFTISLEAVRENLGFPSPEEVNNRKYRQFIMEPIEKAIEEIEEALLKEPEAKEYGFTITPVGTETSNIHEWLKGYLEIGLKGDFAETFIRIATKAEREREKWTRIKTAEAARIAARQEAKAQE